MGKEFVLRNYKIILITGETKYIRCSRHQFKTLIKELKIRGYKILDN